MKRRNLSQLSDGFRVIMESLSVMFYLEAMLFILLLVGVIYMISVNKKLKMLKSGGDGFKAVVIELNHATENAKNAIQGLKLTVRDAEHGLDGNLKQARSAAEELRYLLEQAGGQSDNLQPYNPRNVPPVSDNLRSVSKPALAQNKAKNFADQTLEKVAKRKQILPNPIVHSHEKPIDNTELGQNLPQEHREMALQRREQALRSIAAKNGEHNQRQLSGRPQTRPTPQMRQPARQKVPTRPETAPRQAAAPRVAASRPAPAPKQAPTARQVPTGREAPTARQAPRPAQEQRNNVGAIPAVKTAQPPQKMSLSEMVGRHAELEKKSFIDDSKPENSQTPTVEPANGTAGDRRQSLFQKLSKTR